MDRTDSLSVKPRTLTASEMFDWLVNHLKRPIAANELSDGTRFKEVTLPNGFCFKSKNGNAAHLFHTLRWSINQNRYGQNVTHYELRDPRIGNPLKYPMAVRYDHRIQIVTDNAPRMNQNAIPTGQANDIWKTLPHLPHMGAQDMYSFLLDWNFRKVTVNEKDGRYQQILLPDGLYLKTRTGIVLYQALRVKMFYTGDKGRAPSIHYWLVDPIVSANVQRHISWDTTLMLIRYERRKPK